MTSYGYHPATGELLGIDYNDATPDVGFVYDRLGRQTTITDAAGTRLFAYNDALQLESETITGLYNRVITRRYEESGVRGRAVGFNVGAHYAVDYAYDHAGRLNTVGWNANGVQDVASYSYLAGSNLLAGMTTGAGQSTTYAYEPKRNVKTSVENRFDGAVISKYDYVYDQVGRRTSVVNSGAAFAANGDAFSLYEYNDRNELVESSRYRGGDIGNLGQPVGEEYRGYGYDPIGNRMTATEGTTPYTYATNSLNQYVDVNGVVPVHDDDGNLTEMDGVVYSYNGENRLVSIQPETPADGDMRLDFVYDYMGRRVEKTKSEYAAGAWTEVETTAIVYDGWNLVEEIGDVETKYYVWGLDLSQSLQGAGGIGGLIVSIDGDANAYYFQYDANGNVGQMVDGDGNVGARYEYDAFGQTIVADGPEALENPYRFSTKYTDESGMVYYGYRYYLSDVGRWNRRDPVEENGGINLYVFVENSPANKWDLNGHQGIDVDEDVDKDEKTVCDKCELESFRKGLSFWFWYQGNTKTIFKPIKFFFKPKAGCKKENCALVQFKKGYSKVIETGRYGQVEQFGVWVDSNFPNWTIDSFDSDPIYAYADPRCKTRWCYHDAGGGEYMAEDGPTVNWQLMRAMKFRMCVYTTKDIPKTPGGKWGKAIQCIDWEANAMFHRGGNITELDGTTPLQVF